MPEIFNPDIPQNSESELKYGADVSIHNVWQRHTQKASGEVFNAAKTGISSSNISEGGAVRAEERGKTFIASADGAKGYRSSSPRTLETFEALMKGYANTNQDAPIRESVRVRQELSAPAGTKEFMAIYEKKWSDNKKELLAAGVENGKYPDLPFGKLSPDQQEEIAEAAEEPVVREWIDNTASEMAKLFPPRIQAANFATFFDRRHERMGELLNNGSKIDLFHNTHKTATEPFMASGVLIRKSDGKRITKLDDIGGSLLILDQWESNFTTDKNGNPTTTVTIRGQEYTVDEDVLLQLVQEGRKAKKHE